MLFVTVGTHEQQFNRLVEYMDRYAQNTNEEIVIQTGFSTYKPKNCKWNDFFSYNEMRDYINLARIVITHGGPSSFMAALQIGKTPIVVPRQKRYFEHVNDHQLTFCKQVFERMGTIIVVEDINELANLLENYEYIISNTFKKRISNNIEFCNNFNNIVEELFDQKRN